MIFLTCDVRLLVRKVCEPHQADQVIDHLAIALKRSKGLKEFMIEIETNKLTGVYSKDLRSASISGQFDRSLHCAFKR